jgi:hypothetical protein
MSLAAIKCYSVSLTHKKQTKTRKKKNNMAQKKDTKKTVKVRDLKPKKDAKGGGPRGFHGGH